MQELITKELMGLLEANRYMSQRSSKAANHIKPVVKIFNPCGAATWLISEIHEDGDTLFGLCDLGMGFPELGYVSLSELQSIRKRLGLPLERDTGWVAEMSLVEYAEKSRREEQINA